MHISRHYISDEELQEELTSLNMTSEDYLRTLIIPQKDENMGGTARSNTFSEIFFSDIFEYFFGYYVPRVRQYNMSGKTLSEHGTDVIGIKYYNEDKSPCEKDELLTCEVKAVLSKSCPSVIEEAIKDSIKDNFRYAITLNYMKRKLKQLGQIDKSKLVERFQKKTEPGMDFVIKHVCAGMTNTSPKTEILSNGEKITYIPDIDGGILCVPTNTDVYFIYGNDLMKLAHDVYERCTK